MRIALGNLNLLDGCRKYVRRDGRWLEKDISDAVNQGDHNQKKKVNLLVALSTFRPSEITEKKHPKCCEPQEGISIVV